VLFSLLSFSFSVVTCGHPAVLFVSLLELPRDHIVSLYFLLNYFFLFLLFFSVFFFSFDFFSAIAFHQLWLCLLLVCFGVQYMLIIFSLIQIGKFPEV
jgi:hypothetical protein